MKDGTRMEKRVAAVMDLRNAALALLERKGESKEGNLWFEEHTPENPEPRLSILLARYRGYPSLEVWARLRGGYQKVLNMSWRGDAVAIVSFRRGDWENELLAMGRAPGAAVH
jgi:hypothetical protein